MGRTDMGRWGELREMRHFGRVLRLVWPHRTYLVVAMAAMLGVALCLTASIVSLYPVLKVVIGKESIPDFVDRLVVQDRLEGVALAVRDMTGLKLAEQVGARAVQVVQISRRDSLYKEGVRQFDYITGVAGEGVSGRVLIRRLVGAQAGESIGLTVWRTAVAAEAQVTVVPERAGRLNRTLRWAVVSLGFSEESEGVDEATWINQRKRLLVYILLVFLAVQLVGNVCRFVGEYYGAVVGTRTLLDLRRLMYSKTLMLPVEYFHVEGVSGTMGRFVQDSQDVLRALRSLFGKVLKEPMKAGGAFAVAIYMQPKLTLVLIVVSPVAALMFRQFGRRVRRANEKVLAGYGMLLGVLKSTLLGIKVVKAYTMERRERKRHFKIERHILKNQLRIERVNAMSSPLLEVIGVGVGCAALYIIMGMVFKGTIREEELLTLLLAMAMMFDSIRKLSNVYTQIQKANAGAKRIFELVDRPTEFDLSEGAKAASKPEGQIEFRGIRFAYSGSDHPALDGVDLTVPVGSVVAVVGPNGSGKTTLVSLLMRLFNPQEGQVLWDGVDVGEFQLRSLRRQISYVSQETVIFADTISNNISYGSPRAGREVIERAARQAHADEFIGRLSQGYDTVVGEHGVTLSGGERQRLAIARAILRDAPVLIFDEATSQIDADSEAKIQDAMDHFTPGRTALVIAHRFSTIQKADVIVVMDRGKIVGVGSHEELMRQLPLYQSLYQTQLRGLK